MAVAEKKLDPKHMMLLHAKYDQSCDAVPVSLNAKSHIHAIYSSSSEVNESQWQQVVENEYSEVFEAYGFGGILLTT